MARSAGQCRHYQRGCELQAPCCNVFYPCRLCHDDKEDHAMDRFQVTTVRCSSCSSVQQVGRTCTQCGVVFGEYYCDICHLYDRDKQQYHCSSCGICRIGPRENFFHCSKCNLCLPTSLHDKHKCVENVSRQNCPVCMEDMHTSRDAAMPLPCGHLLHSACFKQTLRYSAYRCPLCARSMVPMSSVWSDMDEEVAQTPMPEEYQNLLLTILCNDCLERTRVLFHVLGLKCDKCGSYNTCRTEEKAVEAMVDNPESAS
ncbi:RING finger and CHY zinc finger domain-containing protein 1-like [Lethenteron reissneri]|uniref:RING finger and CHY zinc finger domain-containing protein 1-like n=1 Tax=Lethenteron reissneri TaxID=7753 RepID=UPI002AB6318A|nr:RING finger and CHY zinc finger domain-containing protein 1-like [Lethenteron reissneri]XP_061420855.1 RING finger and CHY zinc finger domain-containing protein 1-like [Lethenteron reissneri]